MKKTEPKAIVKAQNPQLVAIRKKAELLLKKWSDFPVKTAEDFEKSAMAVKDFASLRKELKSLVDPEIKAAKAAYDEKRDAYKAVDSVIADGEIAIRDNLEAYTIAHRKAQEKAIEKALSSGNDTKAATIAAKPYVPEVTGLSFTERWHAEVVDLQALLKAIISGKVSTEAVEANLVFLNTIARASKSEDIGIPGVKGIKETSSSVRT